MKAVTCVLVGMYAESRAIVQGAIRLAFSEAMMTTFETLDEALKSEATPGPELLVLANPESADVDKALAATDAKGARRWGIVILGTAPATAGVEAVSWGECNEHLLARTLRSTLAQHELVQENTRLRGDLQTLAYRVSHDMRTPLGGIVSTAEMLKEIVAEKDPASAPLADPIFTSTDELMKLIERVSFLLKACVNPPSTKRVAMGEVVRGTLERLERRILKDKVSVSQPNDWPEVEGVASWLETIWWNFLVNALQHGGAAPRIAIGWKAQAGEYLFWIRDSGSGVDAEKRGALFQPFELLHEPNSARGLGLSIVQRLVELQGGRCGYEDVGEQGLCFYFTLPV